LQPHYVAQRTVRFIAARHDEDSFFKESAMSKTNDTPREQQQQEHLQAEQEANKIRQQAEQDKGAIRQNDGLKKHQGGDKGPRGQ